MGPRTGGNVGSRGARELAGARRPRRLSHRWVSGMELPRHTRPERADEGGARTQRSLLPPGPREPAAPGGSRTRAPQIRRRGTASPLKRVPSQATLPRWHLPAPHAAPPDSGVGILKPLVRLPPSSAPWYAPGDRCLGIFNIWDAANAEVKWNTSGEGGPGGGTAAWTRGSCGCGVGPGRAGAGARRRSSEGQVRGKPGPRPGERGIGP